MPKEEENRVMVRLPVAANGLSGAMLERLVEHTVVSSLVPTSHCKCCIAGLSSVCLQT